jgi:hypothetical protein
MTMKTLQATITPQSGTRIVVTVAAFCITFAPQAIACGNPTNVLAAGANALALAPKLTLGPSSRLTSSADTAASDNQAGDSGPLIVGMWEVTLRTGNILYDHAFQQFYADGNEMQNSALFPPEVGNICFGTWQHDGRSFKLKHYGWLFDHGNFVGTLILKATITVGTQAAGNTYSGNFVADVVLPSGQVDPSQHAEGTMQAKRLTIE